MKADIFYEYFPFELVVPFILAGSSLTHDE